MILFEKEKVQKRCAKSHLIKLISPIDKGWLHSQSSFSDIKYTSISALKVDLTAAKSINFQLNSRFLEV